MRIVPEQDHGGGLTVEAVDTFDELIEASLI